MRYIGVIISNLVFLVILAWIFSSISDPGLTKILAGLVLVYMAISGIGMQLARQIGIGFQASVAIQKKLDEKISSINNADKDEELDEMITSITKEARVRDVKMIITGVVQSLVALWMVIILVG